jgi:hypothetical protein
MLGEVESAKAVAHKIKRKITYSTVITKLSLSQSALYCTVSHTGT